METHDYWPPGNFFRAMLDVQSWRALGSDEYAQFHELIHRDPRIAAAFKRLIGLGFVAAGSVNLLAPLVLFDHMAPVQKLGSAAVTVLAYLIGVWWLAGRFPSHWQALAFVTAADALVIISMASIPAHEARVSLVNLALPIGLFIAFALGWRVNLLHTALTLSALLATVAWSLFVDHEPFWRVIGPSGAVALVIAVVVPTVMQIIVDLGRREASVLTDESSRDALTNVLNRRAWETLGPTLHHGWTADRSLVVVLIDVDRFKTVNDTFGHTFGDAVLKLTATRLSTIPDADLVCRYGGDEFIAAGCIPSGGIERFVAMCGQPISHLGRPVTVSVGAAYASGPTPPPGGALALFELADEVLLGVKGAGGDGKAIRAYPATPRDD